MTDVVPAWSDDFFGDGPGPVRGAGFLREIDRELAYGDGTGSGVRVAIIDSGIEDGHPLVGRVDQFVSVEYDAGIDDIRFVEGPHDDLYGHGTACAGIVRALAPGTELVSLRVLGGDLSGSAYDFAHALEWCLDHDVQIVNLSLSTSNEDFAEVFYELVDAATYSDVLVVSAMNNERKRSIPSEFAGVFSVACCDGDDPERFLFNPRAPAAWGAVGIDVEVAWTGGATIVASGNSFAAPVITGHLARIVGAHPGITAWQARTLLGAMAANVADADASMSATQRRHRP